MHGNARARALAGIGRSTVDRGLFRAHRRPFHHVLLDRAPRLAPFLGLFSWEKILDFATIIFLFLFYKYYLIIN